MSESANYADAHAVVLSSRVRLARNLRGLPFPDRAPSAVRAEVCQRVMDAARERLPLQEALAGAPTLRRQLLFEGHLISRHLLTERPESAICMDSARRCTVMINEEDHLRIQVLQPGLALEKAWQVANDLDDFLEQKLDYAFSSTLGYLTSCPTNVGTGMRASAMMHLPALVLQNEMEPIANGLAKIGLTVRGRWGEGTAALGHMFQVSNQRTLGLTEERIVEDLGEIVRELEGHEQNARARLKRERRLFVEDLAARAKGILTAARLMTAQEALERLSELRLGILLGLVRGLDVQLVDELWLAVQPAHLQAAAGRAMNSAERDKARARMLRTMLKGRTPKRAQKENPHE
ncbi:MAG TPA: protein arginine kinase [Kiritimatiellia bacterium]|nr:protein arginine kinase [Kiritimatiellia bacterium]MBP9571888.1 protein arginine kinase [Kiritimatiellia bacterium]HOU58889.1 protein arginine kinase [Kiritimatiellia bacterium]HQF20791.1 protein arginine kinase [Kiritimatiellia bacterium]HQG74913.1 protein arginine kinase [Kiritimatiellia bacterium]